MGVLVLPKIDNHVEATRMADIGLIRDDSNPVALKKAQLPTSSTVSLL